MNDIARDEESPAAKDSSEVEYSPKRKMPYKNLGTDLTLEDMSNPGVHKLMLAENSRLETELFKNEVVISSHYELKVEHAKVTAELKSIKQADKFVDTLYSAGIGAGTALAGIAISIQPIGVAISVALIGIAVSGIAVLARIKRYEN